MYTFETTVRVRYAETDQMGYVYYGNYAAFYEVGRVELFRCLGFSYKALEDSGVMMPVLELHCRFLKPSRYDEERSEEHTSELQSLMRISYAVFCLKKKKSTL